MMEARVIFFLGGLAVVLVNLGLLAFVIGRFAIWHPEILDLNYARIREAYDLAFFWLPAFSACLMACFAVLALLFRGWRTLFLGAVLWNALLVAVTLGLRFWVSEVEHGMLVVREVVLVSDKVNEPIVILHISDLEAPEVGGHEIRALAKVNEQNADLILFTGDLFELQPGQTIQEQWAQLRPYLQNIQPRLGFFGVYGDGDAQLMRLPVAAESPLVMLDHRVRHIALPGGGTIAIKGLSLYQSRLPGVSRRHTEAWLEAESPDAFTILLGHGPDFILDTLDLDVDLCLAGHTHGGQVRIPFFGALLTNSASLPREWARGFFTRTGTAFNISAGLGSDRFDGTPVIRLFCPTEMTRITVVPPGYSGH